MSRKIDNKASVTLTETDNELRKTDVGKLIFTTYQGRSCSMLIRNDRLLEASFFPKTPSKVGAIYIGKIKNMAKNIDACFVEIADGQICFMPLKKAITPFLLNRRYDGRILEGDEILVQVERDAQKTKQASVTAHISITNDYFSMSLGTAKVGYSSKLSGRCKNELTEIFTENAILKDSCLVQDCRTLLSAKEYDLLSADGIALETLKLPSISLIFRTKTEELKNAEDLLKHFYTVSSKFIRLLYIATHRSCFSCLKNAPEAFETSVSQAYNEYEEIVTDNKLQYEQLQKYIEAHNIKKRIRLYQDKLLSLSALYSLDSGMEMALGTRVWLKSGGYLIIEPTEALTVIDVNTGKYEAKKDTAETFRKINREAAKEVAIQLRLRNLSGIIIVDFINMQSHEDNKELLDYLKSLVQKDKTKTTVVDITPLGLVEITRKKINKPLTEQFISANSGE